jgi:hypothetical protein
VLSTFGGLYALIFKSFAAFGFLANNRLLFAKFIRTLYFVRSKENGSKSKIKPIFFKYSDKFSDVKKYCCYFSKKK